MFRNFLFWLFAALSFATLLHSCGTTRYVPEGSYRLTKTKIVSDEAVARKERIKPSEVERYVRQNPNRRFLGTNFYLWAYNASDTSRNNWWNRTLRKIGEAPVILDSVQTDRSADNLHGYMKSRGYFDSWASYEVKTKKKKAQVTYHLHQGDPYYVGRFRYYFRDSSLTQLVLADTTRRVIQTGDIFDINELNAERARIAHYLRDRGYYNFNVNNVSYFADSLSGGRDIDVTLIVRQHLAGYDQRGEAIYEDNSVYYLGNIYVNPAYDPVAAVTDPDYFTRLDTISYRGLEIITHGKPVIRPRALNRLINLRPGQLYSASEVQKSYTNIMRQGFYRSSSIVFTEDPDSLSVSSLPFEPPGGSAGVPDIKLLTTEINAVPSLKQSYQINLEGSAGNDFYALGSTVGYQNRNVFRGAEQFDASVTGRYEWNKGATAGFEIGGSMGLSFPTFFTPFKVDRNRRAINPRTRFELSISTQKRPQYRRTVTGFNYGYSWGSKRSSYTFRPIDLNLVKIGQLEQKFRDSLTNPYLIESYKDQFVGGWSGSYIFSTQRTAFSTTGNAVTFRFNWETMGNLFRAVSLMSQGKIDSDTGYYTIFGIRYAQYARFDTSFSQRIMTGVKSNFSYRLLVGAGITYGNSSTMTMPIDRMFFSGGASSMRGWLPRTLGPGSTKQKIDSRYNEQRGNFKLEGNVEYRFPVWGFVHGAVFCDVGNVWYLRKKEADGKVEEVFYLDKFYKQLGFNTGFGVRIDIDYFVFRFDWGLKLHDPNAVDNAWIRGFNTSDLVFNIGVGYPF